MKTQVTISSSAIQVLIAGISIHIDRDELFDSIDTVQKFVKNIWPEKRKQDLEDSGFNEVCNLISQYKPLVIRALNCYTFDKTASSIIIINDDGTIEMKSNEQEAKLDVKGLMQVMSEFSDLAEENQRQDLQREAEVSPELYIKRSNEHFTYPELANFLDKYIYEIRMAMEDLGIMASLTQKLDDDTIKIIAEKVNCTIDIRIAEDNTPLKDF